MPRFPPPPICGAVSPCCASAASRRRLKRGARLRRLTEAESASLWVEAMTGGALAGTVRWQVHLPPRRAPALIDRLQSLGIDWAMDWGGGRMWVALDGEGQEVREEAARLGGEAALVRAPEAMRAHIPAIHPRAAGLTALEQRVRRAFDPAGVFATGRFMEDVHADQLSA